MIVKFLQVNVWLFVFKTLKSTNKLTTEDLYALNKFYINCTAKRCLAIKHFSKHFCHVVNMFKS